MEYKEICDLDKGGLAKKISEVRKSILEIKMQKSTVGIEKPNVFYALKKDLARLLTVKSNKFKK